MDDGVAVDEDEAGGRGVGAHGENYTAKWSPWKRQTCIQEIEYRKSENGTGPTPLRFVMGVLSADEGQLYGGN
jgi:hypothetical protein